MLEKVLSEAYVGLDALAFTVEVAIGSLDIPTFTLISLTDRAVEKVRGG